MIITRLTCTQVRLTELFFLFHCVQVRVAVGQTVLILASQHLQTVINTLVNQPLPYDRYISKTTLPYHDHKMFLSLVCQLLYFASQDKDFLTSLVFSASVSSWTSEMWMALGADPIVANQIIEMVMEKLLIMAPYVDQRESMIRGGTTKVATNQPLAVSHRHSQTCH